MLCLYLCWHAYLTNCTKFNLDQSPSVGVVIRHILLVLCMTPCFHVLASKRWHSNAKEAQQRKRRHKCCNARQKGELFQEWLCACHKLVPYHVMPLTFDLVLQIEGPYVIIIIEPPISTTLIRFLPSVLWRCWLGGRKGIQPVKNWVVRCWHGYLSGARCRLAYGPADATATHCLLLQ